MLFLKKLELHRLRRKKTTFSLIFYLPEKPITLQKILVTFSTFLFLRMCYFYVCIGSTILYLALKFLIQYDKFLIQLCVSFQIAMGQGQADLAIQTLKECARNGEWLCLKNLHLVTSWLPILEKVRVTREKCI